MIEQTDLIISEWRYTPTANPAGAAENAVSHISLDVMKKRASTKKGIACRFSCRFTIEEEVILLYVAEDSYVIDLADIIDKNELLTMIRNSYSKFKEKFDLRKLSTLLQAKSLPPLDESMIEIDAILPLLN